MATNGTVEPNVERALSHLVSVGSALISRVDAAQRLGYSYAGKRDVYEALGWPKTLQLRDISLRYERDPIAGAVVDRPVNATWRGGFELSDDEASDDETEFEAAWRTLDQRLRLSAHMKHLDRLAGLHEYAAMYLGVRGQAPDAQLVPIRQPEHLLYVSTFSQPHADVAAIDERPDSARYGLPQQYGLSTSLRTTTGASDAATVGGGSFTTGPTIVAHHSRVLHVAEDLLESRIYGRPRLLRVWNALVALEQVYGAAAEGFWRSGARARYHANISPDFAGQLKAKDLEALGDQVAAFVHGMQDWLRTSGTDVTQLQATTGDPRAAAEVLIDLISAATSIPRRILLGSERGELASSQDKSEWDQVVDERRLNYAAPVIVRPLVDVLIRIGALPQPRAGEYEVIWGDITGPSAESRADLADRIAAAELKHAQAEMLGKPLVTRNELRETLGLEPVEEIEDTLADDDQQRFDPDDDDEDGLPRAEPTDDDEDEPEVNRIAAMLGGVQVNAVTFASIVKAVNAARDATFRSETADRVLGAAVDFLTRTAERLGLSSPDPTTAAVRDFVREYSAERVRNIGDTTRDALREELVDGMRAGEGKQAIARRVRKVFRDASRARALTIAQTEVNRAAGFGALEGMRQVGSPLKTWNTLRDGKVREAHVAMEGQTVPIGDPFTAPGGETAMHPGGFGWADLDIGCRCFISAAEYPTNLRAAIGHAEAGARMRVHERRVAAAVRRAFRAQQKAVIEALEE